MIKFIDTLDFIVSRAAFLAFVPVILKFASKRLKLRKADRFLMKIHEPAGKAAPAASDIHRPLSSHLRAAHPACQMLMPAFRETGLTADT